MDISGKKRSKIFTPKNIIGVLVMSYLFVTIVLHMVIGWSGYSDIRNPEKDRYRRDMPLVVTFFVLAIGNSIIAAAILWLLIS